MKIKVCGMKENVQEVANCQPDYMGFIFYEKSPRNFSTTSAPIPDTIKKVGVFVDATYEEVRDKARTHQLQAIQLHGDESPEYCRALRELLDNSVAIWKVFSVGSSFDFDQLSPYEEFVNLFVFDTAGAAKGGNGVPFDWNLLDAYPSSTPFLLSGGIGLESLDSIRSLYQSNLPLYGIDVNSRFETSPGHKNITEVKQLINSAKKF